MPRKVKDEDKVENIIRGLLKEPENRRCINCNSLGPQYVCTTFCTFVCTNCSGVHREFSHRVKSVSMAKFNSEEMSSLQAGGNERARQIYFKSWDPQRNLYPDSSNLHKLREFIRHVYIDRKYAGQNSYDRPSFVKSDSRTGETYSRRSRDDFLERHSIQGASNRRREEFELHTFERSIPSKKNDERSSYIFEERRSPHQIRENVRSASHRNRRIEIVDDRFRDDGSVKLYDRYASSRGSRSGSMSPVSRRNRDKNVPAIRTLKDVLCSKAPVLAIGPPPTANVGKDTEEPARQSRLSEGKNPIFAKEKQKQEQTVSLMDFDAKPVPAQAKAEPQKDTMASNDNNKEYGSDALSTTKEKTTTSSNLNSMEDSLFGLSDPPSSPSPGTQAPSGDVVDGFGPLAITVVDKEQTSQTNSNDCRALVTQQWHASQASNDPTLISSATTSEAVEPRDGSKPGGRRELPADLFAANFTGFTQSSHGWQMRPPYALGGYDMQFYPSPMSVSTYPHPQKPSNPFDIGDDRPQSQFPSMSHLHGALPSLYPTSLPQHVSPYGMKMPPVPGAYVVHQPNNMPLARPQAANSQYAFASLNHIETSPAPPPSSISRVGNPFG